MQQSEAWPARRSEPANVVGLEALRQRHLEVVVREIMAGAATRSRLAQRTGLSRTTVWTLVGLLRDAGIVAIDDADAAPGAVVSTGGRPAARLTLTGSEAIVLGVHCAPTQLRFKALDLAGKELCGVIDHAGADTDVREVVEIMRRRVSHTRVLRLVIACDDERCAGLSDRLEAELDVSSQVRCAASLAALAEATHGNAQEFARVSYLRAGPAMRAGSWIGGTLVPAAPERREPRAVSSAADVAIALRRGIHAIDWSLAPQVIVLDPALASADIAISDDEQRWSSDAESAVVRFGKLPSEECAVLGAAEYARQGAPEAVARWVVERRSHR